MTLHEWRGNGERLANAYAALHDPTMTEMLAILETSEHPARLDHALRDGFDASLSMGEIRGFERCLQKLRSFAEPLPLPREEVPVTWNAKLPE